MPDLHGSSPAGEPQPTGTVRTRFAPSPTGLPHVGNLRNALFSWLLARRHGGQFIFRLEDTDRNRYQPEAEAALLGALEWLGLDYDEGPCKGGPFGPYVQSERLNHYHAVVEDLIERGCAYRCYCPAARLEEIRTLRRAGNIHPIGYDRHCRNLSAAERERLESEGRPSVVRFAIPVEGETLFHCPIRGRISYSHRELDDHVLLKSDGFPTYHLAHFVDDHLMRISHVIRSEEWIPSTPRHLLQYQAMGWEAPEIIHPPLIMGKDPNTGQVSKLSKRHGAVFVGEYREQGYLPDALLNFIALVGWSAGGDREILPRPELIQAFDLAGINAAPGVFDSQKLTWMNGVYIREMAPSELAAACLPFLHRAGLALEMAESGPTDALIRATALVQERLKLLADAPQWLDIFLRDDLVYDEAAANKWLRRPESRPVLQAVRDQLQGLDTWNLTEVEAVVRGQIETLGVKAGEVIHPTRVAATGRTVGPALFETLEVLGRERVVQRLTHALHHYVPGGES